MSESTAATLRRKTVAERNRQEDVMAAQRFIYQTHQRTPGSIKCSRELYLESCETGIATPGSPVQRLSIDFRCTL